MSPFPGQAEFSKIKATPLPPKNKIEGLPWLSSGLDSALVMQGVQVQSLVRELDLTSYNCKDTVFHISDLMHPDKQ